MFSFETYKTLSQNLQAELLWKFGVSMELIRNTAHSNIELYSLFDFFVEIYFEKKTDDPLFLKAFSNTTGLEPYLSLIEIDSLFETN